MWLATAQKLIRKRNTIYKRHEKDIRKFRNLGRQINDTDSQDQALRGQLIVSEIISLLKPLEVGKDEVRQLIRDHTSGSIDDLKAVLCLLSARSRGSILSNCIRGFSEVEALCYYSDPTTGQKKLEPWAFEVLDRYSTILELHISLSNEHGLEGLNRLQTPKSSCAD